MPMALPAVGALGAIGTAGTLGTIAAGAVIAGSAVQAVGMITKSKTLQKIGGMTSMFGGLGMGAQALAGGMGPAQVAQQGMATGGGLFAQGANQLNATQQAGPATGSSIFAEGANRLTAPGSVPSTTPDASSASRVSDFLTKYNTTANILGGMGQGFAQHQMAKMQQEIPRERLKLEEEQWRQRQANMAATSTIPNLRDIQARQAQGGLLNTGAM